MFSDVLPLTALGYGHFLIRALLFFFIFEMFKFHMMFFFQSLLAQIIV